MTPADNPDQSPLAEGKNTFVVPTSFAQQSLWYVNQLTGGQAYNVSQARRLRGALNIEALTKAIQTIAQRHEILRTGFDFIDQKPVQIIAPTITIDIPIIDLTVQPESAKLSHAIALLNQAANQPFDLTRHPLWCVQLLCLAEDDHILGLNFHHIIIDGWSLGVFWRELHCCYAALMRGDVPRLADLPIQYADYAIWQQQYLASGWEQSLNYWQQQLGGELPTLHLPNSRPRPAVQTFTGRTIAHKLPLDLTVAIKSLSQNLNCTLFMILLGAFQILLYRYSDQTDVIVGTPIAGRTQPELEKLIGYFVNTLALRSDLSGNPSFREFMMRVREVTLAAYDHAELPFEKLVEVLRPPRDVSRSPLFQVMFALQNLPQSSSQLGDLDISSIPIEHCTAKFDLILTMQETTAGLVASLNYNTDLFDSSTIERLLGHYQQLLTGIISNLDQPLAQLPLLTPVELEQQGWEWNDTSTDYPRPQTIPQLFAEQVGRSPQAIAVTAARQSLTYAELHHHANQLAHYLIHLGVKPETRIGICLERSQSSPLRHSLLDLVIAMLGILQVGAVYVPLDPSYPSARLAFMMQDADVEILLTHAEHLAKFPPHQAVVICLDRDWPTIAQQPQTAPINPTPIAPQLAYVMYTSGSTGQPKGVAIPHHAVNRLVCQTNYVALQPGDRIAQAANIAFDAATFEVWGALLNGATLVGLPQSVLLSPTQLANFLRDAQITTLFLTTALFHQCVSELPSVFASLRYLLVGGETLEPQWVRQVLSQGKPQHFLHVYGPTESTTFTTYYEIAQLADTDMNIPIGRPIANTQVYLLDRYHQPVPIGIPGEICIGGEGLAWGYLNRPDITAEKFIAYPNSPLAQSTHLYKTGDRGCYRPDGNIVYLGRQDHQVKIRGFRVELGEVESALMQHPDVQAAIVLAQPHSSGTLQLVAYLMAPTALPLTEFRQFLQSKLPEYMVPAGFQRLAEFPLTANGKIDRQALAKLPTIPTVSAVAEPRNPIEYQLLEIWREVLNNRTLGITDNFFEVGGHSLLGIRLFTQIEKIFSQSLPLNLLYQAPTVAQLATIIYQEYYAMEQSSVIEFQAGHPDRPALFCLPGAFGSFFYCYGLARYMDAEQPIYAIREPSRYGKKIAFSSVEDLAAYYVQIIKMAQPQGPYFLAGYSFGGLVVYEVAQQLQAQGDEIGLLGLLEPTQPTLSPWLQYYLQHTPFLLELRTLSYYLSILDISGKAKLRMTLKMIINPKLANDQYVSQQQLSPEQQYLRDYLKTIVRSVELYRPCPYPGTVSLFVTPSRQQRSRFRRPWEKLAEKGVLSYPIAGRHRTLGDEPHVKILAEQLQNHITAWRSGSR
jgi:amino acid adenylation domain-containing protein